MPPLADRQTQLIAPVGAVADALNAALAASNNQAFPLKLELAPTEAGPATHLEGVRRLTQGQYNNLKAYLEDPTNGLTAGVHYWLSILGPFDDCDLADRQAGWTALGLVRVVPPEV